jgi:hypothetical protein
MADEEDSLSQFDISKEETDKLVSEVIRFILFKFHQSSGTPIKREDLTQIVTKNYRQRNLATHVINEAKKKLSNVFGYDLKELQRARSSSTGQSRLPQSQSSVDSKSYVLVSELPLEVFKKHVVDETTSPVTGFTFVVLAIVQLAGGKIPEGMLLLGLLRRSFLWFRCNVLCKVVEWKSKVHYRDLFKNLKL